MPSDIAIVITNDKIEQLRRERKYTEAYEMAQKARSTMPETAWVNRQLGWCIYYLLKECANATQSREFLSRLQELADIDKEHGLNAYITKALVWPVRQFVVSCIDGENVQEPLLYQVYAILRQIKFDTNDENYSILLGAFIKAKKWSGLKEFIEWWNLDNIKSKDCEPYVTSEGRKIMSVAEQAYIAYSNILLHELQMKTADSAQVMDYANRLAEVSKDHPDFQYPSYFRAKLLLESGHPYEAREALLPFIKRKANDYWVWDLYGDASTDDNMRMACYCKALSCSGKEQYLRKLHFKVCDLLLQQKQYDEAATELRTALGISERNGWTMPYKFQCYTTESWYLDAHPLQNNSKLYAEKSPIAEELIYSDIPSMAILITHINKEKQIANFVAANKKEGFFSCKKIKCREMEAYACRMTNDNEKHYKVYSCRPINGHEHGLVKDFEGTLKLTESGIGFVDSIFIPKALSEKFDNETNVKGQTILSYNHKKDKWGWRAIVLEVQTQIDVT